MGVFLSSSTCPFANPEAANSYQNTKTALVWYAESSGLQLSLGRMWPTSTATTETGTHSHKKFESSLQTLLQLHMGRRVGKPEPLDPHLTPGRNRRQFLVLTVLSYFKILVLTVLSCSRSLDSGGEIRERESMCRTMPRALQGHTEGLFLGPYGSPSWVGSF